MADTSRKRSRKSKLVPRECSVDEDDLELQVPATKISKNTKKKPSKVKKPEPFVSNSDKPSSEPVPDASKPKEVDTSVLRKINASARESTETEEILPRKFEVNIEVESCDDEELLAPPTTTENEPTKKSPLTKIEAKKSEPLVKRKKHANPTPLPLTLDFILDAADKLNASMNIADRILNIHLRNTIGYEVRERIALSSLEDQIQKTLDDWRSWQSRSFYRQEPLFYKCYICNQSYWYLAEFRHHLTSKHADDEVFINLEKYEKHEINLIASNKKREVVKDIFTDGLCYRCGRDFDAHAISSRIHDGLYRQEGCSKHFPCCTGLRDHFPLCSMCKFKKKPIKCDICKSRFDSDSELDDHLILSHSVRSDVPIMTPYVKCQDCSERFELKDLHNCVAKRFPNFECQHCSASFPNNLAFESHIKTAIKPSQCDICGDVILYSCMKFDHLLIHTENFMAVKKCVLCDGLNVFVSNEDAKAHWMLKHKALVLRRKIPFPKVFVPWTCIYQRLTEINSQEHQKKVQQQIEKNRSQASLAEVQEESKSWPEGEKVLKEEQDSDADEKKSLIDFEEDSVSAYLREKLDSSTEIIMDNVVVKKEPEDLDSPRLIIKEEPLDQIDNEVFEQENQTENNENQISVKQEILEEEDLEEYEDDLIRLNFNLEDYLVKEETIELTDEEVTQESQGSDFTEESLSHTEESMLEPEIIITGQRRKKKKLYKCSKCGFEGKHKKYREHLENNCKIPVKHRTYKCTKCNTEFGSMKKYLTHFEQHGYQRLACPECLKISKNFTYLGQHVQSHIKQSFVRIKMITYAGDAVTMPDFQCKMCTEKVNSMQFFEHWETHVKAQPSFTVKVISKPKRMDIHGQLHETIIKDCIVQLHKMPRECNHCHRGFKRTNECKRHIIEHLLVDAYNQKHIYKELKCQICDSGFGTSDKYKQHMRDHASLPVYKCELCDRTFSDSSNFTKHKKVHNLRVVVCDLCGKKFQTKLALAKHIEQHQNAKPIICEICKKIFYFDSSYRRHYRYFHDKTSIGFGCIICGDRFERLKDKWDHMWEVHKERKHKADCPICHQSFRKYSDVRAHARDVHMMEISVLSVKTADLISRKKDGGGVEPYVSTSEPVVTVGRVSETLVVYDSE